MACGQIAEPVSPERLRGVLAPLQRGGRGDRKEKGEEVRVQRRKKGSTGRGAVTEQGAGGVTRVGQTFVKWVKLNYINRGSRAHSLEASRHAAQAPRPRCPSAYLNGVSEVHK